MPVRYLILVPLLLVAACGEAPTPDPQPQPKAESPAPKADPARVRMIAGRWASEPGSVGNGRWVTFDVAGDGSYVMDLRGKVGESDAVFASSRGSLHFTGASAIAGSGADAKADIADLANWTAEIAQDRTMRLRGSEGREIALSYRGL